MPQIHSMGTAPWQSPHTGLTSLQCHQGTRLREQALIMLHLLLEPTVHSERRTDCSCLAHSGHYEQGQTHIVIVTLQRLCLSSDSQQQVDSGIHGTDLAIMGDTCPFLRDFLQGRAAPSAGLKTWREGEEPKITRSQRILRCQDVSTNIESADRQTLGVTKSKLSNLTPLRVSQTEEPTLVEPEKVGVTQMENSSVQNGPRTSKLQDDVFSFVCLGFLLFSVFFILFPVPLGLVPHPHNWYLRTCFFLLFTLLLFGSG